MDAIETYISNIPQERQAAFIKLRQVILDNLPQGFEEKISYGIPGFVVPHSVYAPGYHCDPRLPLPFTSIANQKNFIALYSSSIYADKNILDWFVSEYPKHCSTKLDMGKCCIRFKNVNKIPYELISQLMQKMTVKQWIELYENRNK